MRIDGAGRPVVDSGMYPHSALALRGYGAEPGDFRARQLGEAIPGALLPLLRRLADLHQT